MATALTYIFGEGINVTFTPRQALRQFSNFAGAHGIVSMLIGSAGYKLIVTGVLRTNDNMTYNNARKTMIQAIENIESWMWAPPQTFTYRNETYYNCVFEKLQLLDSNGIDFPYVAGGACRTRFAAIIQVLL